ncbi:hypothetical protein ACFVT5_36265 [Streptomyces sp. NPDC058001]|uniref:hypothetical protein n=1 Tax=Streptomyces sp. NPDC058001 TaxID=3346300 RepID=UPI0036E78B00
MLVGSAGTGSFLDTGLLPAVPWLALAVVPLASIALLPRAPRRQGGMQQDGM